MINGIYVTFDPLIFAQKAEKTEPNQFVESLVQREQIQILTKIYIRNMEELLHENNQFASN